MDINRIQKTHTKYCLIKRFFSALQACSVCAREGANTPATHSFLCSRHWQLGLGSALSTASTGPAPRGETARCLHSGPMHSEMQRIQLRAHSQAVASGRDATAALRTRSQLASEGGIHSHGAAWEPRRDLHQHECATLPPAAAAPALRPTIRSPAACCCSLAP